jgi:glycosyltransferase involved in cell wall biosynthesis
MDDAALLESFCLFKSMFSCDVKIIYSFHGFKLDINEEIVNKIDKVLFLTKLSYEDALYRYNVFSPEIAIVGNGVDSSVFFPSKNEEEKFKLKKQLGFDEKDTIICWMSNDRRKKGLHLFIKIIDKINKLNLPIQFLIIGSSSNIENKNVINLGRILNSEIAKYLQISDYYFFTSLCKEGFGLSLIEAIKCGNTIVTSNGGGIPEVIEGLKNINLVKSPNIIENWLEVFKKSYTGVNHRITNEEASLIWNYKSWEEKFIKSIS